MYYIRVLHTRCKCFCLSSSESFELFQISGRALRRLTRASSNSGKKANVESEVALREIDEGMPQSSHRVFGAKPRLSVHRLNINPSCHRE